MAQAKQILGAAVLGGIVAAKLYGLHKYQQWRSSRSIEASPGWRNRRSFAGLPRRKQREIIYAKRAQVKDLENITYGAGYSTVGGRRRRRHSFLTRNKYGLSLGG